MKILLCNTAIRKEPDPFPPTALTTLHKALKRAGYDSVIYDNDVRRPSDEKLFDYFKSGKFDIIGISSVVSTAYRYTKNLARIIKNASPETEIILGGNMAAAFDVILRKCAIDICVIGEGEKILVNLVKHFEKYGNFNPSNINLHEIKGIAFLDAGGNCKFTGYEAPTRAEEIEEPDYDLVKEFSNIENYLLDPSKKYGNNPDPRIHMPHRHGKKVATIFTAKSCINKCTFCHRWVGGYRVIPIEKIFFTINHLIDKHNVGYFCISDECFGENRKWLDEFMERIKPLDVLFEIAGARVDIVKKDPSIISRLKEAGLIAIYFGMESGSNKILKVMEKNASREENLLASKICVEAGVYTLIQLVIGMPGENDHTINETIDFVKKATGDMPYFPLLSVNYLQSLPGTPCYDFLRRHGLLGKTIDEEEQYLLGVSDINASEFKQYINVSEAPLSKVKLWKKKIVLSATVNWLKQRRWKSGLAKEFRYFRGQKTERSSFMSNKIKLILEYKFFIYRVIDLMGGSFWKIFLLIERFYLYGAGKAFFMALGLIKEEDQTAYKIDAISLRKNVQSGSARNTKAYSDV